MIHATRTAINCILLIKVYKCLMFCMNKIYELTKLATRIQTQFLNYSKKRINYLVHQVVNKINDYEFE